MDSIWTEVMTAIQEQIAPQIYDLWLRPLRPGEKRDDGKLEILTKNDFSAEYVGTNYGIMLESAYQNISGEAVKLAFRTDPNAIPLAPPPRPEPKAPALPVQASPEETGLLERYTFDSFVVGECNAFAHAAAAKVADAPARFYNPLYIHGGVGLGKTHLLHAVAHKILDKFPDKKVRLISSETFMTLFVDSIQKSTANQFKEQFRSVDILLVDDIQFFSGKTGTQVEFFHTFNALYGANKQIILTSDSLPSEIEFLEERLRSRFAQGLVVDIYLPDLETRVAILKKKALLEGIDLQDDVAFFLADAIHTNVRELEGALIRLFALASMSKEPITMALVKESLRNILRGPDHRQVSIDEIQRTVSAYYKITPQDLRSKKRTRLFSHPRQVAMYLCKQLTDSSYPDIGKAFGGRDHTTVIYAVSRITEKQNVNKNLSRELKSLTEMLSN
ncbi:MAG: chromosomal replication initiator protein DnaA [Magnetococcales bacterium]|nr:chromosomal replication initiator protein DnaA [Magnetococcales bacterium]